MDRFFEISSEKPDAIVAFAEFAQALSSAAAAWPALPNFGPLHTGGWDRTSFVIVYADRSRDGVIRASFRVDFDGTRALAACVAAGHVDQGSLFGPHFPEGDRPFELAAGSGQACATEAADWFFERLSSPTTS